MISGVCGEDPCMNCGVFRRVLTTPFGALKFDDLHLSTCEMYLRILKLFTQLYGD